MLELRDKGLSILLIEHDMAFVMNLCDTSMCSISA